jgi:hypothetical protein
MTVDKQLIDNLPCIKKEFYLQYIVGYILIIITKVRNQKSVLLSQYSKIENNKINT